MVDCLVRKRIKFLGIGTVVTWPGHQVVLDMRKNPPGLDDGHTTASQSSLPGLCPRSTTSLECFSSKMTANQPRIKLTTRLGRHYPSRSTPCFVPMVPTVNFKKTGRPGCSKSIWSICASLVQVALHLPDKKVSQLNQGTKDLPRIASGLPNAWHYPSPGQGPKLTNRQAQG